MSHSPTPWTLSQSQVWPFDYVIRDANGQAVNTIPLVAWSTSDTLEQANARPENVRCLANARLMAGSGELLEALQLCRKHMYEHASNTDDGAFEKLCAIISMAASEAA